MRASHSPSTLLEVTSQDLRSSSVFKSEKSRFSIAAVRLWNSIFDKAPAVAHKVLSTPLKPSNVNRVIKPENTTLILELIGRLDPQAQAQLAEALASEYDWSMHPDVLIQYFQARQVEQLPAAAKVLDCFGLKNSFQGNPASIKELNRLIRQVILPMMTSREISRPNRAEQMTNWICDLLGQPPGRPSLESLKSLDVPVLMSFEKMLSRSSSCRKLSSHKALVALIRKAALIKQVIEEGSETVSQNYWRLDKVAKKDKDMALAVCACNGLMLEEIHEPLRRDRDVVMAAMNSNGEAYSNVLEPLRSDREVLLTAVRSNGNALAYASEAFKADKEVVTEAVKRHGLMLLSASAELKADRDVVLEAVSNTGLAILYANSDLRADYDIAFAAATQDPSGLFVIADELKDDRSIIQKAVARNGAALQDASARLKDDLDIVMLAVAQRGMALQYASPRLRGHEAVVKTACLQNPNSIQYASNGFKTPTTQPREIQVAK